MKYILFGAGKRGRNALHFLGAEKVSCFCDNKQYKNGETIEGVPVINVNLIREYLIEDTLVVITTVKPQNIFEITKQLMEMHIDSVLFEDVASDFFEEEKQKYSILNNRPEFEIKSEKEYLISWDKCDQAGHVSSYFWQDLWAAKKIAQNRVELHFDIGSRLDGFIAHVLSFGQNVCQIDIRPLNEKIEGLSFVQADATNLDGIDDNSLESISALCSIEHFGLGRYGDPIDPEACFKCFAAIQRKLKEGGNLYLSVPIGKECLVFNAHRVFYISSILHEFREMELIEVSTCYRNEIEERLDDIHKYDDWYDREGDRMGLFWFRKK